MKIKTTVNREEEIDISPPIFKKEENKYIPGATYLAILNESTGISLTVIGGFINIVHGHPSNMTHQIKDAINWGDISEEEFLIAHEEAIKSISLKPELVTDPNDLKEINI